MKGERRLVIGISGASGAAYGVRLLEAPAGRAGRDAPRRLEIGAADAGGGDRPQARRDRGARGLRLQRRRHRGADRERLLPDDGNGGRALLRALLSEIAYGATSSLLTRAADVALKERRRLVLLVRETPLHLGHLRAMTAATEAGAVVYPPVPALYARPATIEDMIDHTLGRVLDLFEVELDGLPLGRTRRNDRDLTPTLPPSAARSHRAAR